MIIDLLRLESGFNSAELSTIITTAPRRYKKYPIEKKSGGVRWIAQPARELKILQYILLDKLLGQLAVHEAAYAYVSEKGIRANAEIHRRSDFILKMDFASFFNSIKPRDFNKALKVSGIDLSLEDRRLLHKLLFWGDGSYAPSRLSIGAPTSPLVSNAVMFEIDTIASQMAKKHQVIYTRYADDICVSGGDAAAILSFERGFRSLIGRTKTPELRFNEQKRGMYSRGVKRMVTGLIITPDQRVSIGRERKREISAMVHHYLMGKLDNSQIHKLHGLISFAFDVEPQFVASLNRKYEINVRKKVSAAARAIQLEISDDVD